MRLLTKHQKIKKAYTIAALAIFICFSNTFLFQKVISTYEYPVEPLTTVKHLDKPIVILGGFSGYNESVDRICFQEASDRFLQGLQLKKMMPDQKLIISGGSAEIYFEERAEADYIAEYLSILGIDSAEVAFETQSRNTYENAYYTSILCDSLNIEKEIILITSAFHMKRAKACFDKAGFKTHPLSAHSYRNYKPLKPSDYLLPSLETLQRWPVIIKEWLGLLVYKVKGYT